MLALAYFLLNAILSVIAVVLVDRADQYWKRQEDAPTNLISLCMIGTMLKISTISARIAGVTLGLYWIMNSDKPRSQKPPMILSPAIKLITAIIQVLLFVPIFIYIFVSEVRFRIIHRNR